MSTQPSSSPLSHFSSKDISNLNSVQVKNKYALQHDNGLYYCTAQHSTASRCQNYGFKNKTECVQHLYPTHSCSLCKRTFQGPRSTFRNHHAPTCRRYRNRSKQKINVEVLTSIVFGDPRLLEIYNQRMRDLAATAPVSLSQHLLRQSGDSQHNSLYAQPLNIGSSRSSSDNTSPATSSSTIAASSFEPQLSPFSPMTNDINNIPPPPLTPPPSPLISYPQYSTLNTHNAVNDHDHYLPDVQYAFSLNTIESPFDCFVQWNEAAEHDATNNHDLTAAPCIVQMNQCQDNPSPQPYKRQRAR